MLTKKTKMSMVSGVGNMSTKDVSRSRRNMDTTSKNQNLFVTA